MSGDDRLREVIVAALRTRIGCREADLILALPEVAALRAKADGADRVRELHEGVVNWDAPECEACSTYDDDGCSYIAPWPCPTIRALDGSTLC